MHVVAEFTTETVMEDTLEPAQTMEKEPCTQQEFTSDLKTESEIFHDNEVQTSNYQDDGLNSFGTSAKQTIENSSRSIPSAILIKPGIAVDIKHTEPTPTEYAASETSSQSSTEVTQNTAPESAATSQPTPTQTPTLTQPVNWGEQFHPLVNQAQGGIWPPTIPNIPSGPSVDSNGQDLPKGKQMAFKNNVQL